MKFTHLHTHSHYSLLQALPKIPELVKAAKAHDFEALALTDNGNLYGALEFYKECEKAKIKPIIGVDAYLAGRTRHDKQAGVDKDRARIILLAKNVTGYKNLLKLVTESYLEGFYYKPRIDFDTLQKYHEGLIAISSSYSGDISTALRSHNEEKAQELVKKYKELFKDDFYIEITNHPELANHNEHMKVLADFSKKEGVPIVAAHDIYYINPEDRKARETLMAVMQGGAPGEKGGWDDEEEDFSFLSSEEMKKRFKDLPEALENVEKIIDKCDIKLELGKWVFPPLEIASGRTADEELRHVAYEGLEKRKLEKNEETLKRLEYELEIIKTKGYSPYFLVVADLLKYAHDHGILTTIRGSVAGSLTTFCVGITNVNPLEYKLPFERFLNPERPSAPDIDMDYADNRRDEMIAYAKQKYGHDHVAQIGTFGTMMARGSVRDTARALGFPYSTGDAIAKLIPMGAQGFPMTIDKALAEVPELQELYNKDKDTKTIIDMARKIEGCARHISVHAAGVVISPTPLTDYVPLQFDTKGEGKIITQYDMHSVDENSAGLLKFDFLGIKNLAILADAVKRVKKIENIDIDIENVRVDDKKTFDMLALGETIGLFQLNGSGMTRFLKELKPSSIHDINAMVALYRPGPMETIPQYIERKHNPELVKYSDPRMKEYLGFSNGLLVYQDDVMLTAIHLAGYSWLDADKLRKAMGKKIPEVMAAEKDKLMDGLIKNGMAPKKANELWKLIEPFAAYGFNKAHAASYGKVAYQTAYMKANFPAIYMSAVLTADSGDIEKVAESINECNRIGIPVLPPDINESFAGFSVVKQNISGSEIAAAPRSEQKNSADKIRFGLTTIKNFGEGIAEFIIEERKKNGHYKTLEEFLTRVQDRNLNKKSLEALIKTGAMDALGDRMSLLHNIENLLTYNKQVANNLGQDSLFASLSTTGYSPLYLAPIDPATETERLNWEKELLGLYVSGHPLDKFRDKLVDQKFSIKKIKEESKENDVVVVGGILEEIKPFLTKKGDKMLFTKFRDLGDVIEMAVFPKTYAEFQSLFTQDACLAIKARVTLRNGEKSLVAEKVKKL